MRYGIPPINDDFLKAHEPPLLTSWPGTLDELRDQIEDLKLKFETLEPQGTYEQQQQQLLYVKKQIAYKTNLLARIKRGAAAEATPVSTLISSPYSSPDPDLALLIENPIVWMASLTSTPTHTQPTDLPNFDAAKTRAAYIRTTLQNPPIDKWVAALHSRYHTILRQEGDPKHELRFYQNSISRQQATSATSYNPREHGHRATVLLDFDWNTGLSTPYFVVASKAALAYLQYKSPLDLHNLHTDPLWVALEPLLPCHTEIWPIGRPHPLNPLTFGSLGTTARKQTRTAVKEAIIDEIQILQSQNILFEMFEIEARYIRSHAPNWDYQIPKVVFTPDNLHYLDKALQWNSDKIRLVRDRRSARGPLWGTRVNLKAFGDTGSDTPDFIIPTDEVIPTSLYNPSTRDLLPPEQAFPTILAATNHTNKVNLKGIWLL